MASAVRLVIAVFLLGSVLLIVLLVGQGMAAAQPLPLGSGAAERVQAPDPGVAGPAAAVGAVGLARTPGDWEVVAGLDQAARTLRDTGTALPAALDVGTRPAGTPGSSERPAVPAPDLRTPATKRLEVDSPGELRDDGDGGDDLQPGSQGVQVALVAAEAASTVVAQRQRAASIAIPQTASDLLVTAQWLDQYTRRHTAHNPDSIVKAGIEPDPRTEPNPLVNQVLFYVNVAYGQEMSDREEATHALGNAAKALTREADWSIRVTEQLYRNAHALARQADQAKQAEAIKTEHAQPLLQHAVDAWNKAVGVRTRLGDPTTPERYSLEKLQQHFGQPPQKQKDGLLDDHESSQAGIRLAGAEEAEPAAPLAHAGLTADQAPAAVSGGLDRTPLEATAFDPALGDSTPASAGEGTGSPTGVQQTLVTDGDTNGLAGFDAALSLGDGGVLTG